MRRADICFGGTTAEGFLFRRPLHQEPHPTLQTGNFSGLPGHHIGQLLHRPHQVGHPFFQKFDPVHPFPRLFACP